MDVVAQLQSGTLVPFMLVLARLSGLFALAPVFSSRLIPVRAKLLIALAVAFAATPPAAARPGAAAPDVVTTLLLVVKEIVVGLAVSMSVAVVFAAIAFAGSLIDLGAGFSFANVLDPLAGTQISVMGQVYSMLASAVFLAVGGHALLVAALVRSFDIVPLLAFPDVARLSAVVLGLGSGLFAVGLEIAAPVVVTLLVVDVAVGFLARTAPQMNIFGVELPAKVTAMFALLVVTAPFLVGSMGLRLQAGLDGTLAALLGA